MTNKKLNNNMPDQMFWLDNKNLVEKINNTKSWITWYNLEMKKLDYLGKDHYLYCEYIKQVQGLEKILEALLTVQAQAKILLGE